MLPSKVLHPARLTRGERLRGRDRMANLFAPGSRSLLAYPLRAVCREEEGREEGSPTVVFMVSVPKRLLHRAVDRNKVKRRVREAYRQQKHLLASKLEGRHVALAFLWISPQLEDYWKVRRRVRQLLLALAEAL